MLHITLQGLLRRSTSLDSHGQILLEALAYGQKLQQGRRKTSLWDKVYNTVFAQRCRVQIALGRRYRRAINGSFRTQYVFRLLVFTVVIVRYVVNRQRMHVTGIAKPLALSGSLHFRSLSGVVIAAYQ